MWNDDDNGDASFTINEAFAQRYQNKKRAEEITNLKRKYGDEDDQDSESEEEEDELGELVTPEVDAQIMRTIATIRAGKPEVYDPTKKFFEESDIAAARQQWEAKQAQIKREGKPMHLKDFHRRELLKGKKGGEEEDDNDDDGGNDFFEDRAPLTHAEEQDLLRNSFKTAATAADDDDAEDFLSLRDKSDSEKKAEEEEYRKFLIENMAAEGGQGLKEYREYSANRPSNPDEDFLMEYVLNRGWMDKDAISVPKYDDVIDLSDDEEAVDNAEDFERTHNFRFEEEGSTSIVGHARTIEGSMRRKDDKRKKTREAKKARQSEESLKKAEELKRLKNLKKEEIRKRLEQIKEVAGGDFTGLEKVDLEGEFDPDAFDQQMAAAFDSQYYEHDGDDDKPDFGDDIDVDDIMPPEVMDGNLWDEEEGEEDGNNHAADEEWGGDEEEGYGYDETGGGDDDENFNMDADYLPGGAAYGVKKEKVSKKDKKSKKKAAAAAAAAASAAASESAPPSGANNGNQKMSIDQFMDEYYSLDYEDMIGDLPTRFKYRKVDTQNFGLTGKEILEADDADLNEIIGLKKLAPFRRPDLVARDLENFSKSKKKRLREFRKKLEAKREQAKPNPPKEKKKKTAVAGASAVPAASLSATPSAEEVEKKKIKKEKQKEKRKRSEEQGGGGSDAETGKQNGDAVPPPPPPASATTTTTPKAKKIKKEHGSSTKKKAKDGLTDERLASYGIGSKKNKH
ncbi:KRI1-like family C-terminal-domain-containing protein [Geranomyces variabilis]|nr:KRI1-like family C-terminal-domain-containing protein [Geranomyces variabilis]KAJ3137105.1 KRRI-Interacting protein 1 [Geranomyces variabilis]